MLDTLPHQNYRVWVDNLCTSVNFLARALKHEACVMVEGMCRSGGCGFLEWSKQEFQTKDAEMLRVFDTTKEMELEVEGLEETIVAASVCDTKPAHFLSSLSTEVKWIKKTRKTRNAQSGSMA